MRTRVLLLDGPQRAIVCALLESGDSPIQDYLESLDVKDYTQFFNRFTRMSLDGKIGSKEQFRHRVHTIWCTWNGKGTEFPVGEFKIHSGTGKRIMACLDGREWVLTHGFRKGSKLATEGEKAGWIFCQDRNLRLKNAAAEG